MLSYKNRDDTKLYPQYLDKISFNAVIDEQNDFACSSNFLHMIS